MSLSFFLHTRVWNYIITTCIGFQPASWGPKPIRDIGKSAGFLSQCLNFIVNAATMPWGKYRLHPEALAALGEQPQSQNQDLKNRHSKNKFDD